MQIIFPKTQNIIDERLKPGIEFIRASTPDIEAKVHDLGGGYFANVDEYNTATKNEYFESHRKYIDIQAVVKGAEIAQIAQLDGLKIHKNYDEENDYALYHEPAANIQQVQLTPGTMAVFYPEDAHRPGQILQQATDVKKIVVKVPL